MDNVKDNRFNLWLFQCYKDNHSVDGCGKNSRGFL